MQLNFLCSGGVSYAPFILLLISNLFCTKGEGRGGGIALLQSLSLPSWNEVNHFVLVERGGGGGGLRDKVNLLCPCGRWGGEGGGGPLEGVGPNNHI
jgi:hypothetical protein